MGMNLAEKIISAHLVDGKLDPGADIAIRIDQTLTQDATGTMAYLQFEALGLKAVKTDRTTAAPLPPGFQIRHLFLTARQRYLPPGAPGAVRCPGQNPAGFRFAYSDQRRHWHAGDGGRWPGCGGGHGRRRLLSENAGSRRFGSDSQSAVDIPLTPGNNYDRFPQF